MEVEGNPLMEKEKKQFIDLYRKSKDITEFLSEEDLEFIKTHKDK